LLPYSHKEPRRHSGSAMEYKHFIAEAFQQEPGKWRASLKRPDGTPLAVVGPRRVTIALSITHVDSLTAEDALHMAIEAIDAGVFSRPATLAPTPEDAMAS
jgi:hypothetical protein